jgi:tetratricopeptide (TPR) repeat protein
MLMLRPGPRRGLRRGTSATSWYDAGCRLEASDPERAIAAYERALAGCPGLADAHNNLGRLLHDAGSLAAAESSYRLAICADAGIALYWFNLGVVVEDQGRRAEAVAAYERALALDPAAADAHYNLARLLELAGRRLGDEVMLRRAVRHLLQYRALTGRNASAR